jgi:hypothetical protein
MKNAMARMEIELATSRLVAECPIDLQLQR